MDGFVVAVPLMRLARLHQNKSAAARDLEDLESSSKLPSSTSAISRPVTGATFVACANINPNSSPLSLGTAA